MNGFTPSNGKRLIYAAVKFKNSIIPFYAFVLSIPLFCQCSAISESISGIKESRNGKLNLSHSHLTEIPSYVFKMTELKVLNLHDNKLTKIPAEIGQLVNLEKLVISRNDLIELPPEIGKLVNLKKLSVKANKLTYLPKEIGQMKLLEELWLSQNNLTSLPDEIGDLEFLSHLYIDYNEIELLPNKIGNLRNLRHFVIGRNRLKTLPPEFYTLTGLIILDISFSGPKLVIEAGICDFRRLETLIIDQATLNFAPRCLEIRANSLDRFSIIIR